MGIRRIACYFDVNGFRETMEPIINQLQSYDLSTLRRAAKERGSNIPSLWGLLGAFSFYPDDLGNEEKEFDTLESRMHFWIMIILASFCQDVENPVNARATGEALRSYIVEEELIEELRIGRPLGALLFPQIEYKPALQRDDAEWPFWCRNYGGLGWLDKRDVNRLLETLTQNERYMASKTIVIPDAQQQIAEYEALITMLNTASTLGKGLFLGISV